MPASMILTVIGCDRPGLTQQLAEAVLEAGGNWLESHLSRLGGTYVGSVLVELPEDRVDALRSSVEAVDAAGLRVTLVQAGTPGEQAGREIGVELVGQDRPGIVREVTTALTPLGANIEDFDSSIEHGSWSGGRLFRARLRLRLPADAGEDDVRAALERISGEIMVDFNVAEASTGR